MQIEYESACHLGGGGFQTMRFQALTKQDRRASKHCNAE